MLRPVSILAAAVLALSAVTVGAQAASAANPSMENQFVSRMNADRAQQGLAPLTVDPQLTAAARSWSDAIEGNGSLSHNPNIQKELPAGWTRWGENVGAGPSVSSLDAAFMASPEHRANILGAFTLVGVGVDVTEAGTIWVTVDFVALAPGAVSVSCTDTNQANNPSPAAASGYYVLGADGGVFSYGSAVFHGSVPGLGVRARTILMAVTPDHGGYWVLGGDGGVFTFGDARFFGSVPGTGSRITAVDLKPSPSGQGYWVLGADGSVFAFGDAPALGSLPQAGVHGTAVKLVPTPTGQGYWILGADGGIFSFGDAAFHGSLPGAGVADQSVSMASTATGDGYWVLGADGGIFSFGDAVFHGSVPGIGCQNATGVQLAATTTGLGYYVLASDGSVFPFGDAPDYGDPSLLGVSAVDLGVVGG
jgi:Cysteine-rich secretory protein family